MKLHNSDSLCVATSQAFRCRPVELGQSSVQSVKYPRSQATWVVSTAPRPGLVLGERLHRSLFRHLETPAGGPHPKSAEKVLVDDWTILHEGHFRVMFSCPEARHNKDTDLRRACSLAMASPADDIPKREKEEAEETPAATEALP